MKKTKLTLLFIFLALVSCKKHAMIEQSIDDNTLTGNNYSVHTVVWFGYNWLLFGSCEYANYEDCTLSQLSKMKAHEYNIAKKIADKADSIYNSKEYKKQH